MFLDMQSEKAPEFRKDTVYRLKNSTHIDWKRFTTLLASRIISDTMVIPELISDAIKAGIQANYVLFDSWFSSPKVIRSMKELELDVVSMVKKEQQDPLPFSGADVRARCGFPCGFAC